ncbi:MAG: stage II sporulation protein E (SpoIIE) [bacterium]
MLELDCFLAKRPFCHQKDTECGDTGIIKEFDNKVFIAIVDVLGHGKEAYEFALVCQDFLEKNYYKGLIEIMKTLHESIKGLRGVVAGLCLLDINSGVLKYVGIGNITARKFGLNPIRLIPQDGIIGYAIKTPKEEAIKLSEGDVFILL